MNLVDTSVLVARVNERDSLHQRALSIQAEGGAINPLVLCEVANVLENRIGDRSKVISTLKDRVRGMQILPLPEVELEQTIELYSAHFGKLSFTDCALIVQGVQTKSEIVSFDEKLVKTFAKLRQEK